MSMEDKIGAAEAKAILAEARALHPQITFTHRGEDAVDLYALVEDERIGGRRDGGRQASTGAMQLLIPNQTGFAAKMTSDERPVVSGDTIEYPKASGRVFRVQDNNDIVPLSQGYVYRVLVHEAKTLAIGTRA